MTQEQLRMQMLAGIITEGQYKEKLNEWAIDPVACIIEDNELDRFGEYDSETDTFEVEIGSDAQAEYYTGASGGTEWYENERLLNALNFRYETNLRKTVDRVYSPDTKIEFI